RFLEGNTPTGVAGATTAEGAARSADEATTEGAGADAATRADLDARVKAMSQSLRLPRTMPQRGRSTSDMPESERTTSDSGPRTSDPSGGREGTTSGPVDREDHLGHA